MDTNALGERGEHIVKSLLTHFRNLPQPLFRVQVLDAKWPTIDLYVEATGSHAVRPILLIQVKTTRKSPASGSDLSVAVDSAELGRLRRFPGPVYIAGVDELTQRVYVRAVGNLPAGTVGSIPAANLLTPARLPDLYDEVVQFWQQNPAAHTGSRF